MQRCTKCCGIEFVDPPYSAATFSPLLSNINKSKQHIAGWYSTVHFSVLRFALEKTLLAAKTQQNPAVSKTVLCVSEKNDMMILSSCMTKFRQSPSFVGFLLSTLKLLFRKSIRLSSKCFAGYPNLTGTCFIEYTHSSLASLPSVVVCYHSKPKVTRGNGFQKFIDFLKGEIH